MAKLKKLDQKTLELKRSGALNPRPDSVSDTLFQENPFFDPKDLLQVRYEMLRRHSVERVSIVDVAWAACFPSTVDPKKGTSCPPKSSTMWWPCELPSPA
jgi:hypothetical protein